MLFLPIITNTNELYIKVAGTISSVDSTLSSEFSIGGTFEYGVTIETDTDQDMWGVHSRLDGTRFDDLLKENGYTSYFKIDTSYTASDSPTGQIFIDKDDVFSTGKYHQWLTVGENNFNAPTANGLVLSELHLKAALSDKTFTGESDTINSISKNELLKLNTSGFSGSSQESQISFSEVLRQGPYKYVRVKLTDIEVVNRSSPLTPNIYLQQADLLDINGNNFQ